MLLRFLLISISILFLSSATRFDNDSTSFLLIGDTGKDNDGQLQVSLAMQELCSRVECDYGMLAGDNIYPAGVESEDDPILEVMFDKYYNPLEIPFLIALGNHDYGKLTNDWKRGGYQLLHAKKNPNFHLPSFYYVKETQHAVIAVLDTTRLMWKKEEKEQSELLKRAQELARTQNKWFFVLGHHPYLSNGNHGNVGKYEGVPFPYFVSGSALKKFLDQNVCGKADFYLSGHDHSLQLLEGNAQNCELKMIVSGTGASATKLHKRNEATYESLELGFFHLVVKHNKVSVRAYNQASRLLYEKTYGK